MPSASNCNPQPPHSRLRLRLHLRTIPTIRAIMRITMPTELRAEPMDFDADGDDDSTPEGDTDHDFWTVDGNPINSAWMSVGKVPPGGFLDGDPNVAEVVNYASKTKRAVAVSAEDQANAVR